MKFYSGNVGLARSLLALLVSLALVISTQVLLFASPREPRDQTHTDLLQGDLTLSSATAVATDAGVLLQWRSSFEIDNAGFNIYRLKDGRRTRVNREIIPGSVFIVGEGRSLRGGYSYSWFDSGGTASSIYYIESVNLQGISKLHNALTPVARKKPAPGLAAEAESVSTASASSTEDAGSFEKFYPAFEDQLVVSNGPIEDQWTIAAQPGLKISIKRDGWYRVTQPQMVAAGFNPSIDISKLRLFEGSQEVAINTSQSIGLFASSDFIEFYGRGLDTPTSDTRIYYLIAGTTAGKRVRGELSVDSSPQAPPPITPTSVIPTLPARPSGFVWVWRFLNVIEEPSRSTETAIKIVPEDASGNSPVSSSERNSSERKSEADSSTPVATHSPEVKPLVSSSVGIVPPTKTEPGVARESSPLVANASRDAKSSTPTVVSSPSRKKAARKKRKRSRLRRENNHAESSAGFAPSSFDYTAERKDRTAYFTALLNGDAENFFGQVLSTPVDPLNPPPCPFNCLGINIPNPDLSAPGSARLEIALQGVSTLPHQIGVEFNGAMVGSFSFSGFNPPDGHAVLVINIPVSQLQDGPNTLRFISAAGSGLSLVDYVRVTYPHAFIADGAKGNIHLTDLPNPDDMLVVGGKTYTFKTSPTSALHIAIGNDRATTATNIANRINTDRATTFCSAVPSSADVALSGKTGIGNAITLTVDGVRLTKTAFANADVLKFTLRGTQSRTLSGFSTPSVKLIDYTDPFAVGISKQSADNSAFPFAIRVPTSSPRSKAERLVYAIPNGHFEQPAALSLNQPSTIHDGNLSATVTNGANFLIVAHKNFIPSSASLLALRQTQGLTAAVVDVDDVYDEFSYGVHGPQAIKDFLSYAATHWMKTPQYVVFLGDASYDSRNYLNFGNFDLVPTKLVDATFNETASDGWLTDFDNNGIEDIPVGRLPVRTAADADLLVSKIVNFAPLNVPSKALLVADEDPFHIFGFVEATDVFQSLLPASMTVQRINRDPINGPPDSQIRADIIAGFNQGRALVSYSGHGNVDVWTGVPIFDTSDALALTNGNKLSFVVVMNCLNGYFHAPVLEGIAEALMRAPNGGAVAAFASSGLTVTQGQHELGRELYTQVYGGQPIALGDAIKAAKGATTDIDVRRTWIFFGDPSMKIR
jgi:peptidase C25-like protein